MKLSELFSFETKSKRSASYGAAIGAFPFFTSSNEISKYVDDYDYDGEYLIVGDGGAGNCKYYNGKFSASDHNFLLTPLPSTNAKCVRYFLMKDNFQVLNDGFKGSGIKNVSKTYIKNIEYFFNHAYSEQQIVDSLEIIESAICIKQKQLSEMDELIEAKFVEMFGTLDEPKRTFHKDALKNLCRKITDGKHGGCTTANGTDRYFVGAKEIYDNTVHYETAPQISVEEFEKDYKRCNIEIGDLLIVNTGATIGKSAIASDARTTHTLLQKSVAMIKVKPDVLNPVFLQWCYRTNTKMYLVESASAQPNLLLSTMKETVIYVPEMIMQQQFERFVEEVYAAKRTVQAQVDDLKELLYSKMDEYFC